MQLIEHMLRERMGLDAPSIGSSLIHRTVRLRMKSLGLKRSEDYKQLLDSSPSEWNELIESVIVTETWFFRDGEPFTTLVRLMREAWLPAHPGGKLRLLSIPCSTGEEPYSLVMALQDAGLGPDRFEVDAVDISARVIARAQRGVYGRNSFRGKNLAFRARYFQEGPEGFELNPAVKDCVRFFQGNILHDGFMPCYSAYDFIFCRNLLIYFDRPTQQKALGRIHRWLAPTGVLFVGPAELPLVLGGGFTATNIPMSFSCRKAPPSIVQPAAASPRRKPSAARIVQPPAELPVQPSRQQPNGQSKVVPASNGKVSSVDLEKAKALADAGKLQEAMETCEAFLRQSGPSAQAFYLMGLLRDAAGDLSAIEFYRKALYLEPNHYETLLQMSLLSQKQGDAAQAQAFKRRAQRARNGR